MDENAPVSLAEYTDGMARHAALVEQASCQIISLEARVGYLEEQIRYFTRQFEAVMLKLGEAQSMEPE